MKCPFCGYRDSKVIDSRPTEDYEKIRRRRCCLSCGMRFNTYEMVEHMPLMVVKKDNSRQEFNRNKLLKGLLRACEKRPVSSKTLERLVDQIEKTCRQNYDKEVPSHVIGEITLQQLRDIDLVAYVRFASVYRDFNDIASFMQELEALREFENQEES